VNIPSPTARSAGSGLISNVKALLCDPITWKSMAFLVVKLPLGIVSFVLLVTSLSVSVSLTLAPVVSYVVPIDVGIWVPWPTPTAAGGAVCWMAGVVRVSVAHHKRGW